MSRPVIGKDYWPSPTLRRMPSHWTLETEERRVPFRLTLPGMTLGVCAVGFVVFVVQVFLSVLLT